MHWPHPFHPQATTEPSLRSATPESEVGSSQYRVLFLAAMVLFLVTFIVNTMAELVRQRLRKKYSSL